MKATAEKIRRKLRNATTVAELIEELQGMDPTALVVVQSDYGDYVHTQQLTAVENVDEFDPDSMRIYDAEGYSASGLAIAERETDEDGNYIDDEENDDVQDLAVVVLNLSN